MIYATQMGDFWGADSGGSGVTEGDHRERDARYNLHTLCCHPDCAEWIKNGAKTCMRHRSWYDQTVRYPVRRFVSLVVRLRDLPPEQLVMDEADSATFLDCALEDGLRAAYDYLALTIEKAL